MIYVIIEDKLQFQLDEAQEVRENLGRNLTMLETMHEDLEEDFVRSGVPNNEFITRRQASS